MFLSFLLCLVVICALGYYVTTADERNRLVQPFQKARGPLGRAAALTLAAARWLRQAIRDRNPWALSGVSGVGVVVLAVTANAIYQRSLTDVRPEIERVIAIED